MAELVGTVASAISIATLAGEIGSSVIKLKRFCKSIQDAPEDVAHLIEEIEMLIQLLLEIDESYETAKGLNVPLDTISSEKCSVLCRNSAVKLKTLMDTLVCDIENQSGFRKKLKYARIVFRKDKVEKYRTQLDRDIRMLSLLFAGQTR